MMNKARNFFKTIFEEETLAQRSQRMIPAALYGALVATAYVWTLSLVNVYTFPKLPLALDWERSIHMWFGFGLAAAIFGVVAAWFSDEAAGIVGGGLISTTLLGIIFLLSAQELNSTSTFQSILMAATLIGVNMLGAWGLRWMANRHLAVAREEPAAARREHLTRHILTILLIGLTPGVLNRMDLNAEQTVGHLHELLQAAPVNQSVWPQLPFKQVPALEEHLGVEYKIYVRTSAVSAGALDVTVRFEDGFSMFCILPTASGSNFISQCK